MADQDPSSSQPAPDAAATLKARLRDDLKTAMRTRNALDIAVLRVIIAALDNAQAVPLPEGRQRYVVREFGDGSAEAPRLRLAEEDVRNLLIQEVRDREDAAAQFEDLGRADRAAALRLEAAIVSRYLPG